MNIIVCYKIVHDELDFVVKPDRTISFERASLKIGEYDLNAVETGAQLASAHEASLTCLTVGGDAVNDSKLRKAVLARGPQENVAVKDDSLSNADSTETARVLAGAIQSRGGVDLILCGEGSADLYAQQVGVQVGEILGVPSVNAVSAIELHDGCARIERVTGNVVQTLEVPLPAVLSVTANINVPRIPSMKDILAAGKKPSQILSLADLGLEVTGSSVETVSTLAPEQCNRACEILEGDDEETIRAFMARVREHL